MTSRRQRISRTTAERPTYRKILDQAKTVLKEDGFDRFNVQRVLDGADVSRATMYRHFPDVDGLIEIALVENFREDLDNSRARIAELVEHCESAAEFANGLKELIRAVGNISPIVRLRRVQTFGLALTRPQLAVAVAEVQESITEAWVSTIRAAQIRKFVLADLQPRAVAGLIQAVTLGRVVEDVAINGISNDEWADAFTDLVERAFLVPG